METCYKMFRREIIQGINIEEMDNTIFEGEQAACCSLVLDKAPSTALLARIAAGESIIQAILK